MANKADKGPTVPELRAELKARGISGYSNKNKGELLAMLRSGSNINVGKPAAKASAQRNGPTVKELKERAKAAGHTGYSSLRKQDLLDLLAGKPVAKKSPKKSPVKTVAKKAAAKKAAAKAAPASYNEYTVPMLRQQLSVWGVTGYSGKTKPVLLQMVNDYLAGKK